MAAAGSYSLEPQPHGAVEMCTALGVMKIELFARECPTAVRRFCELVANGAYDGTTFHRVVDKVLIQGGDVVSLDDKTMDERFPHFNDESHTRLQFRRRGFVGMAHATNERNKNRCQFFITLDATPWLNKTHTLFGRLAGEGIFTALKIAERPCGENESPLEPVQIASCKILEQPFSESAIEPDPALSSIIRKRKEETGQLSDPARNEKKRGLASVAPARLAQTSNLSFAGEVGDDDDDDDDMDARMGKGSVQAGANKKVHRTPMMRRDDDDDESSSSSEEEIAPPRAVDAEKVVSVQSEAKRNVDNNEDDAALLAKLSKFKSKRLATSTTTV